MLKLSYIHQGVWHETYFNTVSECMAFIEIFNIKEFIIEGYNEDDKD